MSLGSRSKRERERERERKGVESAVAGARLGVFRRADFPVSPPQATIERRTLSFATLPSGKFDKRSFTCLRVLDARHAAFPREMFAAQTESVCAVCAAKDVKITGASVSRALLRGIVIKRRKPTRVIRRGNFQGTEKSNQAVGAIYILACRMKDTSLLSFPLSPFPSSPSSSGTARRSLANARRNENLLAISRHGGERHPRAVALLYEKYIRVIRFKLAASPPCPSSSLCPSCSP